MSETVESEAPGLAAPDERDAGFMAAAIRLGRRMLGRTAPNPAVGALIVQDGRIVGRGATGIGGRPHAETVALAEAGTAARGATLYVSLEPCSHTGRTPPCSEAIIAAGIARVVTPMEDPDRRVAGRGHAFLREAGIEVVTGILAGEAGKAHSGHVKRVLRGLPHVLLKLAVSADGKIAREGRRPVRLTGEAALSESHLLRAEADAILVGIGTARADDPLLTCRLPGMEDRSPVRVVVDPHLDLAPTSRLAATARDVPVWLAAESARGAPAEALRAAGIRIVETAPAPAGLDLADLLVKLAAAGMTRILVEGGARIARSLVEADLVDEVVLFEAPVGLGSRAVGALDDLPLAALTADKRFTLAERRVLGPDLMHRYEKD